MRRGLLDEDEAEFLPAALALQERPVSATARWTGRILIAMVLAALAWATLGQIDVVVAAAGKVVPSSRSKTITSVDTAAVRVLHVQEGQAVKTGDVLLELDASASDAEHDKAGGEANVAALEVARSHALIAALEGGTEPRMPAVPQASSEQGAQAMRQLNDQYRDFRAKLTRLDDQIAQLRTNLPLATQLANDYKALANNRDVSEHAWIEKEQARIDLARQLADAEDQRSALIAQTRREARDALLEGSRTEAASRQDERRAGAHSRLLKLVSPVDGTVQQLAVHTVGAAVPAAQPLMVIVPRDGHLIVEALMENKDVGFVREGQVAQVKIDAFEYTKYGTIPAHVVHVSHDAVQDEKKGLLYLVQIALDHSTMLVDGRDMALSPGMSVNAEVKTGTRRVIEYLLSPLAQHVHEAMRER